MKTLLVPLDFSDATRPLLGQAASLAASLGARVILLHIIEPIATAVPVGASMDVLTATPPPESIDPAVIEKRLEGLAQSLVPAPAAVDIRVVTGLAVDDIIQTARDENADYIVLASHGHGALYHLFSGSVVTGVLKHAPCPVVVVPIGKKD
ncbi:MAG: universal stress protein [Terrimicrobiaceae bacterium]